MSGIPVKGEYILQTVTWREDREAQARGLKELIRCKECKYQRIEYREDKRRKDGGYYVYWCDKVDGYSPLGFDDQYCSEAEREEE